MTSHTQTGRSEFPPTSWTLVVSAGDRMHADWRDALVRLCESYWYPVYAYVRRRGYREEEAQDLTQDFFIRILEGRTSIAWTRTEGDSGHSSSTRANTSSPIRRIAHAPRNVAEEPFCPLKSPRVRSGIVSNRSTTKRRNIFSNGVGPLCCSTGQSLASGMSSPTTGALMISRS